MHAVLKVIRAGVGCRSGTGTTPTLVANSRTTLDVCSTNYIALIPDLILQQFPIKIRSGSGLGMRLNLSYPLLLLLLLLLLPLPLITHISLFSLQC